MQGSFYLVIHILEYQDREMRKAFRISKYHVIHPEKMLYGRLSCQNKSQFLQKLTKKLGKSVILIKKH